MLIPTVLNITKFDKDGYGKRLFDNVQVPGRNSSGETSQGLVLVVFSVKHVLESICQMFALGTSVVMVKKYVNLFAFASTVEMNE